MSLRLDSLKKRWPTFDLPILPFLAPRVFTPWPSRGHYGTQTAPKEAAEVLGEGYDHLSKPVTSKGYSLGVSKPEIASQNSLPRKTEQCSADTQDASGSGQEKTKAESSKDIDSAARPVRRVCTEPPHARTPTEAPSGDVERNVTRCDRFSPVNSTRKNEAEQGRLLKDLRHTAAINFNREWKAHALAGARHRKAVNKPESRSIKDRLFWSTNKLIHHNPKYQQFVVLRGSWHTRFAAITYSGGPLRFLPDEEPVGDPRDERDYDEVKSTQEHIVNIAENASLSELRQFWAKLPHEQAASMWMELMMTTLECYPAKALGILSATFMEPYPPAYALGDCLDFIIRHYCLHQKTYPMRHLSDLEENINRILVQCLKTQDIGPSDLPRLASNSLRLLMSVFDGRQLKRLYETLLQTNQPLHENTLIQFSYRFAKDGQTDAAFEVLQKLRGTSFNTPQMLSLCTVILSHKYRDPKAFYTETMIFEFMISCGLTPNTITHNVLMWNSVNANDHETAWKIHDMMLNAQIKPDEFSYSILLNDAKRRMDAVDIGRVMSFVRREKIVDGPLVTDVLHAIYLLQQEKTRQALRTVLKDDPLTALRSMLPVYCENFELGHLSRIIPGLTEISTTEIVQHSPEGSKKAILVPHDGVLTVMIKAYLDAIQNAGAAVQFYHHFRDLIHDGDPAVECLVEDPRIWDMILITFGRFPELVNECAHIMEDMLNPAIKPIEEAADQSNEQSDHELLRPSHSTPKPDLYTWSILLKIFMDQKQAAAAEKVLSLMKQRNVEPSIVTWNTLTYGYVTLQDADMVADAVNRLEEANLAVDEATLDTLKKLRNRNRFLTKLAEKQKRRKVKQDLDEMVQSDEEPVGDSKPEALDEDEWLEEEFAKEESR